MTMSLSHPDSTQISVTLVVVPREQFSLAQRSIDNIYANTRYPFELIYVDGNSPKPVRDYLKEQSQQRGFRLIRTEQYLSPNHARNLAISQVNTEYVVFIDNDVLVKPGWLEALVKRSAQTGAWAVAPLTLEGEAFDTIHQIGGEIIFKDLPDGRRWMVERRPYMHLPLAKLKAPLKAEPTELTEFHCVLARREVFDRVGLLDEKLLSMAEETDFCLSILKAGGSIYTEPAAVVSYVPPFTMQWADLPYFFLRWSDQWCESSVQHMLQKYNLSPDAPALKHYNEFVHSHRYLAFDNQPELRFKPMLMSQNLSFVQKGRYGLKKMIRRQMNQRANRWQPAFS